MDCDLVSQLYGLAFWVVMAIWAALFVIGLAAALVFFVDFLKGISCDEK